MAKAFDEVRTVMVEAIVSSGTSETGKRERLYRSIRTLDDVKALMASHLGGDSAAIAEYVKNFATTDGVQ